MSESKNTIIEGNNNEVENLGCPPDILTSVLHTISDKDKQINRVIALLEKKDEQIDRLLTLLENKQ